jgi:chemotaxis protein methyltransferase WspC
MNLAPVTDLLRERIGLDPETLGPGTLPRAVGSRMSALGLTAPAEYAARLAVDPHEFGTLLGDLTVPETWFFRGGLFTRLAALVAEAVRGREAPTRYRILSVACSTGEEPYSLAIALLEAGVSPDGWTIDALDLDARSVERARLGHFGELSFRQTDPALRRRYFRPAGRAWELDPTVRSLVRFRQANLFDPFVLAGEGPFDLVFCRNLFIYLHPAARGRALDTLDRLLAVGGLLCMGHAEPLELMDPRFERTGSEGDFLYRRKVDGDCQASEVRTKGGVAGAEGDRSPGIALAPGTVHFPGSGAGGQLSRGAPGLRSHSAPATRMRTPSRESLRRGFEDLAPATRADTEASTPPDALLARAREQADGGRLDEALGTCRECLARAGPSASLYGLMGVLHQARRETDEAAACFQRALYLEPEHGDALTHLMLLCQERGDHQQAARLRRRLDRAARGGEP